MSVGGAGNVSSRRVGHTMLHSTRADGTYCASHSLVGTGTASSDCRLLSFAASLPSLTVLEFAPLPRCLWLGPFSHWSGYGLRPWSHWMRMRMRSQIQSLLSFFLIWISSCSSESALFSAACALRKLPSWRSWSWSWGWGCSVYSYACSGFFGHCVKRHLRQRQSGGCWCPYLGAPAVRSGHSGCSSGHHPQSQAPGCSAGTAQVCSSRPR